MSRLIRAAAVFFLFSAGFLSAQPDSLSPVAPPAAQPEDKCFNAYREGEYDRCSDCINSLLYSGEIRDSARLIKAYEILGVSLTMLEKRDLAKAAFKKLINLRPDAELNPNVYLPDIISIFQIAKFERKTMLKVVFIDTVPAYPRWMNFLPGAAPQFLNKEKRKGAAILVLQAASLGLSIFAYRKENSYYSDKYGYREEDLSSAQSADLMHRITLFTFAGAYLYSLVDGFINKPIVYKM